MGLTHCITQQSNTPPTNQHTKAKKYLTQIFIEFRMNENVFVGKRVTCMQKQRLNKLKKNTVIPKYIILGESLNFENSLQH